jgi:6-phosphogluconolactonase (cycloisomerase 2 family)
MRSVYPLQGWCLGVAAVVLTGLAVGARDDDRDEPGDWGAVFALTNDPDGNELAVFVRDGQGRLAKPVFVPTGGRGTGGGLGNQGALALGDDSQYLYAVNPGGDTITVFHLGRRGPRAVQVVGSGGTRPISLTVSEDLLYVLNAGGAVGGVDSIAGFEIAENGRLSPLQNSVAFLSAASAGPAQIGFNTTGNVLTVTEKATNTISLFAVNKKGLPAGRKSVASKGQTPFGFAFTRDDLLIVSEAFGGAANASAVSSYDLDEGTGSLEAISASVPTTQTAACWVATTAGGEHAYTTNTGSHTVTGYRVGGSGKLTILDADGVTAETGSAPTDLAVLGDRALFVLNSKDGTVGVYSIERGGALTPRQLAGGLDGSLHPTGLVVR